MSNTVNSAFIQSTWKQYPETWHQILRIQLYKGRTIRYKSGREVPILDVRKESYLEAEFLIPDKETGTPTWVKAEEIIPGCI